MKAKTPEMQLLKKQDKVERSQSVMETNTGQSLKKQLHKRINSATNPTTEIKS